MFNSIHNWMESEVALEYVASVLIGNTPGCKTIKRSNSEVSEESNPSPSSIPPLQDG